jgi:hypothetical protein
MIWRSSLGSFTQRYVKRHGLRRPQYEPTPWCRSSTAAGYSHSLIPSPQTYRNTDFRTQFVDAFSRHLAETRAETQSFPIPRFWEHRYLAKAGVLLPRWESSPRKPCGNHKVKWGDENLRKRRDSALFRIELCRFTYLCVKEPFIPNERTLVPLKAFSGGTCSKLSSVLSEQRRHIPNTRRPIRFVLKAPSIEHFEPIH